MKSCNEKGDLAEHQEDSDIYGSALVLTETKENTLGGGGDQVQQFTH